MNSTEEQMCTTEKLLDLNKKSKIKKENYSMLMISLITFSSHKVKDFKLNWNNYKKTLLKTDKPLNKLQSKEELIMKHSKDKLLNTTKLFQLLTNASNY